MRTAVKSFVCLSKGGEGYQNLIWSRKTHFPKDVNNAPWNKPPVTRRSKVQPLEDR